MTDPTLTFDHRPGRIAANLGGSRATARALLDIPYETRVALLAEVARVGAKRVLAFTKTQPTPGIKR
ncbi:MULTISPECIES: hypothetical protein [unclassified Microbacterium]|uniref:hypothetical protein n=1 Tax=unclassified Microbacterium TaxID=2609290 RepID=UPI00346607D6